MNNPNIALADPLSTIKRALPEGLPIKVTEVMPRIKEGGAFVKFSHDTAVSPPEVEGTLKAYLKESPIKPWFNPFRRVRAFLVRGKPWIEDLYRVPGPRIRVEFMPTTPEASAAELTQETLFSLFRPYGKLAEITPQPSDSKTVPRYAHIEYSRTRYATMAKNCMHGFVLAEEAGGGKTGTVLRLTYDSKAKAHWFRDWITGHPRIVVPLVAAIVAAISVAVFDPIRTFFVRMHVSHGLHLDSHVVTKWIRDQLSRANQYLLLRRRRIEDNSLQAIWEDRQSAIDQLQTWMMETADTFIVVQGPRGAGKKELVIDQALKDTPNKLVIDCKPIQEARGDSSTIAAAASEVGYRPVFSWMNSISSLIDLAAMGTIGTKTGFSETLDTQLAKIFATTATALKQVALSYRKKDDKDADLADDDWLEAHPERRPVIVVDNFLHKSNESSVVYDKLSEWAANVTTANIAHVIFLTTDVSFSKSLSKALPDRVFRQITLGDCTPEVARKYVIRHIDANGEGTVEGEKKLTASQMRDDLDELDEVIAVLGGRLTDLEFLARRISSGENPKSELRPIIRITRADKRTEAVQEITEQSASEILKMYLLDVDTNNRKWTPQQAWQLVKDLAANESLRYNEILLLDIFKDGEHVLQALEQAELISISSAHGRPQAVKPGKPVYQAAFGYLTQDKVLRSRLDLAILTQLIGNENKNVDKFEQELRLLADLPASPKELTPRIRWLLNKAAVSHAKVEKYEQESARLKKVLMENY